MIVQPKMRGFICTTAHPMGCKAHVQQQAEYAKQHPLTGPKRVLVVGSSTGYGLACRLTSTFSCGADTVGVFFERAASGTRTATAGWYNNMAFEEMAKKEGRLAISINGDAFSDDCKAKTIDAIRQLPGGQVDLIIYSLAAPKRAHPKDGQLYSSVIKPIGDVFTGKTIDFHTGQVSVVDIAPATPQEVEGTVAVMGGEDWLFWIQALMDAQVLAPNAATLAFSYIGPEVTHAIYKNGTIGKAKEDLKERAKQIDALMAPTGGKAFVSVNKGLVTQASSAIPVVPLYISLLYKIMKEQGTHEGCIEQMVRMYDRLYAQGLPVDWSSIPVDQAGCIRMDDWEMDPKIQSALGEQWEKITNENVEQITDLEGYRADFYNLFGFGFDGVDYQADVEI